MEASEKWNFIVKEYDSLYNKPESDIQRAWESYCSELFNYKKIFGEIDSFRKIRIGSSERVIPDIILKRGNKDIIDIELKQYCLSLDSKFEAQLKSYLKLLNLSVGLIICQKIYLCWLEYNEDSIYMIEIPFSKDNRDGIKIMELLSKEDFSEEKIKPFIDNKLKELKAKKRQEENIQEIKKNIDANLINTLLLDHFVNQNYADDEILKALDETEIKVSEKGITPSVKNTGNLIGTIPGGLPIPPVSPLPPFPKSPAFIIIKTHYERVISCKNYFNCSESDALYHATRHCWRVSHDTVIRYGYVLAVIDGVVKEVYKVVSWNQVGYNDVWKIDDDKAMGRYEFTGKVADDSIRNQFINKQIPYEYRKPGMASPVVFSK